MRTGAAALAVLAALSFTTTAYAADKATHESVLNDLKNAINTGSDLISKVEDDATAKKAAEGLQKEAEKLAALKKSASDLGAPTKEESEKLKTKFDKDMKEAGERFQKEANALKGKLGKVSVDNQQAVGKALIEYGTKMSEVAKVMEKWGQPK